MKVLHIITLFSIGGATENTIFTVDGLIKKGYSVDIATGPNIASEGSMFDYTKKTKYLCTHSIVLNEISHYYTTS